MSTNTFKALMAGVDRDHNSLAKSEFPRKRVYYDVYIDNRKSTVVTRKYKDSYNNKISFLVCVDHDLSDEHKSMLYLTDLEIIETLLDLDDETYSQIAEFLVSCRLSTVSTNHTVVMKRKEVHNGLSGIELDANSEVLSLSVDKPNISVKTPHGITISLASLCDLISLVLSSENSSKRKIIATKYYILRAVLRNDTGVLPTNSSLTGLRTMQDIKKIYEQKRTIESENEFDRTTFGDSLYDEYFQSLA